MRLLVFILFVSLTGCPPPVRERSVPTLEAPTPTIDSVEAQHRPFYDLHEWGMVTLRNGFRPVPFQLSTGPMGGLEVVPCHGLACLSSADKPVLYVHASEAMTLHIRVEPGRGLSVTERWPPPLGENLEWTVNVTPGACAEPTEYPHHCPERRACEVVELPHYETEDADCLEFGSYTTPLLFYRLHAEVVPQMPLLVRRNVDDVIVENRSWHDGIGTLWRIRRDPQTSIVNAVRADMPAIGHEVRLPPPHGDVGAAQRGLELDLQTLGLTGPERAAFFRAWQSALFEPRVPPIDIASHSRTAEDVERIEENRARFPDVILYWLPPAQLNSIARIDATPQPRHLRRAILVRVEP